MASGNGEAPIIKKVKKVSGGGHHGGAWKVAYADFVTAMMAFFLLMWLLNATSEEQRKGIADFFSPSLPISSTPAGGRALLGGDSAHTSDTKLSDGSGGSSQGDDESERDDQDPNGAMETRDVSPDPEKLDSLAEAVSEALAEEEARRASGAAPDLAPYADGRERPVAPEDVTELDNETLVAAAEEKREREARAVEAAFEALGAGSGDGALLEHLSVKATPEGLMIEISEIDGRPLFEQGSAAATETLRALIEVVAPVIAQLENDVALIGHTDATPFRRGSDYSNWRLSADRADAARLILLEQGLPDGRVRRISGAAEREPLSDDPLAPENRRIGIILLRE